MAWWQGRAGTLSLSLYSIGRFSKGDVLVFFWVNPSFGKPVGNIFDFWEPSEANIRYGSNG